MKVKIKYFASLREKAEKSFEEIELNQNENLQDIYQDLYLKYNFSLQAHEIKFSINNEYVSGETLPKENDTIVFIPPVAGG